MVLTFVPIARSVLLTSVANVTLLISAILLPLLSLHVTFVAMIIGVVMFHNFSFIFTSWFIAFQACPTFVHHLPSSSYLSVTSQHVH